MFLLRVPPQPLKNARNNLDAVGKWNLIVVTLLARFCFLSTTYILILPRCFGHPLMFFVALYWYFLFPNCVVILDSNMTKLYRMPMPVSQLQYRTYRCAAFIGCVLFPSVSPFLLNIRLEVCKLSSGGNKSVFARAIMRLSIFLQINAPLPRCPPSTRGCARR